MKSHFFVTFALLALAAVTRADDNVCDADDSGVERPCLDLDIDCIREYFLEHADCKAVDKARDTAIYDLDYVSVNMPLFNVSYEAYENTVIYVDADIVEFTVNDNKKLAVLTVEFESVTMNSNNATWRYFQTGKEPRDILTETLVVFPSVSMNIYISTETWDLAGKRPFTYVNADPLLEIEGECLDYEDEVLTPFFKEFFENLDDAAVEAWRYLGTPVGLQYVQENICDFGVEY
ncbi:fibrohexamerin [Plutella xylostella]|uniref:fibrohexamerin n=1 Tax=Plutella xylostella TaxID=51655 RepID=UPI002032196F|nr:fibrohexamerin [Plutella xylostella]